MKTVIRKLIVYAVMTAFILGAIVIVGGLGRMLTVNNAVFIVATGLGLAYVVDERLKKLIEGVKGV
jgi:hypothetical protein